MSRTREFTSRRHSWSTLLWGWRRETLAGLVTVVVLLVARSVAVGGPDVLVLAGLLVLVASPTMRTRVRTQLRRANQERLLQSVFWWIDLVGRDGRLPTLRNVAEIPAGARYLLEVPVGLDLEALNKRTGEIAVAFNAHSVRIRPGRGGARYVEMVVLHTDPFVSEVASTLLERASRRPVSLWEPIDLGISEDGMLLRVDLPEHNMLIGGEPGAGKSVALTTLVAAAALDRTCSLSLFDAKEVELIAWRDVAESFVGPSLSDAVAALEDLHETLAARYRDLVATRRRKVNPGEGTGLQVVVIDELAYYLRGGEKAQRDRFAELLRDLVARGRAAGIIVIAATQKPSHEIVPTWIRDLFSYRLALRCTSPEASDTILGQGWATQGYNASGIDSSRRGVGYLLAEGGLPRMLRCAHLTDADVAALASRAREVRGC